MLYEGNSLTVKALSDGIHEMCFDLKGESVNKFNQATLKELEEAITAVQRADGVTGFLRSSIKSSFFVGADVTEFGALFRSGQDALVSALICLLYTSPSPRDS